MCGWKGVPLGPDKKKKKKKKKKLEIRHDDIAVSINAATPPHNEYLCQRPEGSVTKQIVDEI